MRPPLSSGETGGAYHEDVAAPGGLPMLAAIALAAAVAAPTGDLGPGARLDAWLVAAGFRGSALVSKGGAVLLRKGYGLADRENGVPYDASTVFSIASIT